MTHICASKLTIIDSDNGLSPGRRQVIIRTNAGILLIGSLGTNFSEILIKIFTFSFKKMHLKLSSEFGSHLVSASMCLKSIVAGQHTFIFHFHCITNFNNQLLLILSNIFQWSVLINNQSNATIISHTEQQWN